MSSGDNAAEAATGGGGTAKQTGSEVEAQDQLAGRNPRVLIVAENVSEKFGGEAILPFHYFRRLRERGIDAHLLTHARVREELRARLPAEFDRMHFVEESKLHHFIWRIGLTMQPRLRYLTNEFILRLLVQLAQRRIARRLIREYRIDVVHQPTPVSPREPSVLVKLGAPLVVGPMNCAVDFPPAFRHLEWRLTRALVSIGRASSYFLNLIFAGKRHAALLLVANDRTRAALTACGNVPCSQMSENGVDMSMWQPRPAPARPTDECRFVFVGRLISSKGADLLLRALKQVVSSGHAPSVLIIGDGPELDALRAHARADGTLAERANEPGKVFFAGWQQQRAVADYFATQDCLVFPTLHECGGAVALEAMAMELPVITSGWGGPADYVDETCGILIAARWQKGYVKDLAAAMIRLARDPALRKRLGQQGRHRVEQLYDWDNKIDRILDYYRAAMRSASSNAAPPQERGKTA